MKTEDPNIRVFNTHEGAFCAYIHTYNTPVRLLGLLQPTGSKDFVLDTTPEEENQLHIKFPDKYKILNQK